MAFKSPQPLHHSLLQRAGCSQGWAPAEHLCAYGFVALFFPWFSEGRKATVSISFPPPLENLSSFPLSGMKYNTERCGGGQGLKNEGFGPHHDCNSLPSLGSLPLVSLPPQPTRIQWSLQLHARDRLFSDINNT